MSVKFSDREAPHFAGEGEEVCGAGPGITMVIPEAGEYPLHCERVKGHEGKHCSQTPEAAKRQIIERQLDWQGVK